MWYHIVLGVSCLVFNVNAQMLGGYCKTPLGEDARCISVYECETLLPLIRSPSRSTEQTQFLQSFSCGFDSAKTPYVCCGTRVNNYPTSTDGDDNAPFRPNPLIPNRNTCGFQVANRIFGGEATDLDEFPWMAILQYATPSGQRKIACGGSLINSRYILTAAHCVIGDEAKAIAGQLMNIRLGEYDTSSPGRDCATINGIRTCNRQEVNISVEQIIPHPRYTGDESRIHDIALVRMASDVQFSDFIQPVCLPLPTEASSPGEKLVVAGWGKTEKGKNRNIKRKVQVPVTSESQCANAYRSLGIRIGSSQICAGGEDGKDSCAGDSGSPLMRTISTENEKWMIEGLVSFGYNQCGVVGYPGVYTRIAKYVSWIHKNVRA